MPKVTDPLKGTVKFQELILYVARESEGDPAFGSVKLNKLLFFSDFKSYLDTGKSITDQQHQKLVNGPAPKQLRPVIEHLQSAKALVIAERSYFGHVQKRPIALREPDLPLFTSLEIATVDRAIRMFWLHNASEISDTSHDFIGWQAVELGEIIPYESVLLDSRELTPEECAWTTKVNLKGVEHLFAP